MQKQTGEYEEELAELEAEVDRLQALVTEHPAVTGQVTTLEEQVLFVFIILHNSCMRRFLNSVLKLTRCDISSYC